MKKIHKISRRFLAKVLLSSPHLEACDDEMAAHSEIARGKIVIPIEWKPSLG